MSDPSAGPEEKRDWREDRIYQRNAIPGALIRGRVTSEP